MVSYEFWKDWTKKTKLEESAIKSLKLAKKLLFQNISKKEIISVYVKGSFVRREMNRKSDVDIIIILVKSKFLKKLKKLDEKYYSKYKPQIQFSGYSLWELKYNKRSKTGKKFRAAPSRAVQHLEHYGLIYGKMLRKADFHQGPDKGHLRGMLYAFKEIFFPKYKEKKFGFSEIVKQVFWLVENEQIWKGKTPPHNWKKLAKSIRDKNHIIHDTLKFRLKPTNDKKERAKFIIKLNKHLSELNKLVNK